MAYILKLDGIRGVAIALVMLFHFGSFAFGWIGVQIFFVLSGYLITSILAADRERPIGAYLGQFYWRRILRIFPLYYFFLIVTAIVYAASGAPKDFANDWPWLFSYMSNFARLRDGDLPTYVHTWSLAVEEQFYMLWPFAVFFLSRAKLRILIVLLLVGSPLLRIVTFSFLLAGHDATFAGRAVYSLPFTQFDAFAAGAAIVAFRLEHMPKVSRWFCTMIALMAASGLATLSVSHFVYGRAFINSLGFPMYLIDYYQYAWGYSLINATAAIAIIYTLQNGPLTWLLNLRPLSRLGKISYGVYVYHLPTLTILESVIPSHGPATRLALFAMWMTATIIIAEISFRYLETPFLRLKGTRFGPQAIRA